MEELAQTSQWIRLAHKWLREEKEKETVTERHIGIIGGPSI
jgi:hypothetical protein